MSGNGTLRNLGARARRFVVEVAVAGVFTGFSMAATAQGTTDVCSVGFLPHWGDLVHYEDGVPQGPLVKASMEVLSQAGVRPIYPPVASEPRLLRDFSEGRIDILVSMDNEAPDQGASLHSDLWLEEYFMTMATAVEGADSSSQVAISPLLLARLRNSDLLPSHARYLPVESVQRRGRLLADGKVRRILDAESNMLQLQYYAGASQKIRMGQQILAVPVRFRIGRDTSCAGKITAINEAISTWFYGGGLVRLRNARLYLAGQAVP